MTQIKPEKNLNKNGDARGMHPNSQKNLKPNGNPNGRPKNNASITVRQRAMLSEVCPFDSKGRTWLEALAENGMRQALTIPGAMSNLQDRLEGKVTQPIGGGGPITLKVIYDSSD